MQTWLTQSCLIQTPDLSCLLLVDNSTLELLHNLSYLSSIYPIVQSIYPDVTSLFISKKFLKSSGQLANEKLYFSVTSKYDPNILYRSLEFTIGDLLDETSSIIPFIYESENSVDDVSIYTAKYFDSYAHEVI